MGYDIQGFDLGPVAPFEKPTENHHEIKYDLLLIKFHAYDPCFHCCINIEKLKPLPEKKEINGKKIVGMSHKFAKDLMSKEDVIFSDGVKVTYEEDKGAYMTFYNVCILQTCVYMYV